MVQPRAQLSGRAIPYPSMSAMALLVRGKLSVLLNSMDNFQP